MSLPTSQPGPIALASIGVCLASLCAVVVFALPPRRDPPPVAEAEPVPEVIAPEAPLDLSALAKLKEEPGHKPFSGTVFEAEAVARVPGPSAAVDLPCTGPKASLLEAAHLLDQAAYVLEQAALFERAESVREQSAELRSDARRRHAEGEPEGGPPSSAASETSPVPSPPGG